MEDPWEFNSTYFDFCQDRSTVVHFLNKRVGCSLWYDTFPAKNKKWCIWDVPSIYNESSAIL